LFGYSVDVLLTVLAVSLLILVHEFGHFVTAKAVGMRVEVFSVGFWKKLFGFKIGDTEYRLSLVPLGGYVKVSGESTEEGGGKPHEFWSKTPGQRAAFVVGGVAMNFVLALVLFIVAFSVGVPFTVAEVGETSHDDPAWQAGLKAGDKILAVDNVTRPTFLDLMRQVALFSGNEVTLKVERAGHMLTFRVKPYYDPQVGLKLIGILPPLEPIVSDLAKIGGENGVSPAQDAGIRIGDRILAIDGQKVDTAYDLTSRLADYPQDPVEVLVQRDGRTFNVRVETQPVPQPEIGISGINATVRALEGGGRAEALGLKVGDRITAVNGTAVNSLMEVDQVIRGRLGEVTLGALRRAVSSLTQMEQMMPGALGKVTLEALRRTVGSLMQVERGIRRSFGQVTLEALRDGRKLTFRLSVPDLVAMDEFISSVSFESGTTLTWVREDGPAWKVGMRPGDRIVTVGGHEVKTWSDVRKEREREGLQEHEIQWARNSQILTAVVTPVQDTSFSPGHLGVLFRVEKKAPERYGALGAVWKGLTNTYQTTTEIFFMLRGFATRQVSPRNMGGIITIAVASYHAAQEGIPKLLYLTAVISAAIAFLNILPIPVLDGGHLLFIAIEKIRGRRLGERALTVAQTVGFVLIVLLVLYVTRNDLIRWL
jgi:regulator of sigma E protease